MKKMRNVLAVLICLSVLFSLASAQLLQVSAATMIPKNVIVNSSFAGGTGWTICDDGGNTPANPAVISGNAVNFSATTSTWTGFKQENIPVEPDTWYQFKCTFLRETGSHAANGRWQLQISGGGWLFGGIGQSWGTDDYFPVSSRGEGMSGMDFDTAITITRPIQTDSMASLMSVYIKRTDGALIGKIMKVELIELQGGENSDPVLVEDENNAQYEADAAAFVENHPILEKTVNEIVLADKPAILAARAAYNALSSGAKALLGTENALLESFEYKIAELEYVPMIQKDVVNNGTFADNGAGWSIRDDGGSVSTPYITFGGNAANFLSSAPNYTGPYQAVTVEPNKYYRLEATVLVASGATSPTDVFELQVASHSSNGSTAARIGTQWGDAYDVNVNVPRAWDDYNAETGNDAFVGQTLNITRSVKTGTETEMYIHFKKKNVNIVATITDVKLIELQGGYDSAPVMAPIKYGVTVNPQNGTAANTLQYSHGALVVKPVTPVKAGYRFTGWYTESTCENEWNFNTDTVSGAMTLYAGWVSVQDLFDGLKDYLLKEPSNVPVDITEYLDELDITALLQLKSELPQP